MGLIPFAWAARGEIFDPVEAYLSLTLRQFKAPHLGALPITETAQCRLTPFPVSFMTLSEAFQENFAFSGSFLVPGRTSET